MGKSVLETVAPVALGLGAMAMSGGAAAPALAGAGGAGAGAGAAGAGLGGAFGSADMLAAGAGGGILGGTGAATGAAAANAIPGTTESMGLLDMGGGNMVNPDYFVGEGLGMPMYTGAPDAPFAEKAGNFLGNFDMKMDPMKAMKMFGGQPQQVARPAAIQRPQMQPATNVPSLYNQTISGGVQLTDEQKRMLMQRLGGQHGLIG